jgi:hypothetical protein
MPTSYHPDRTFTGPYGPRSPFDGQALIGPRSPGHPVQALPSLRPHEVDNADPFRAEPPPDTTRTDQHGQIEGDVQQA